MEVDQERGSKRSCVEAALPERISGGQPRAEALLVDSSGAPARSAAAEEELPAVEVEAVSVAALAVQESAEEKHASPAAVEGGGSDGSDSALPESYNKAPKTADDAEKEDSRKSFSALVKASCSSRAYPY